MGPTMHSQFTGSLILLSPEEFSSSEWENRICGWHFFPPVKSK